MAEEKKTKEKKKNIRNSTDVFKEVIKNHLEQRGKEDELFAKNLEKEDKNLDDCVSFIMASVRKMAEGTQMFGITDEEVFNLAAHYYDEDDIKVEKGTSMNVVVNQHIELNEDEIEDAKEKAKQKVINDEERRLRSKGKSKKSTTTTTTTSNAKKDDNIQTSLI